MDTPTSDFDGAWKEALERFFEPFIAFFFPQVHAGIDWTQPVLFQDTALQQVAPDEPQGKQHVDKLVRVVRRDGTATWLLIHIEIQSQYDRDFPERMFCYHARTYDRDRRLVVSLAVLADEEPTWRPDQFGYALWGCELALRFPVVKLRDLDRAMLEASPNIFAALTLLHRDAQETRGQPQARMQRKLDGYRRILRQGYPLEEIRALLRLMEYLLRLPTELTRPTFEAMKQIESEEVGMTLVTSFEAIGREDGRAEGRAEGRVEGRVEGRAEGQQELVVRLLTRKLGPLPDEVTARIAALDSATMLLLADALLDFATQDDLRAWLNRAPGASPANAAGAPDQAGT